MKKIKPKASTRATAADLAAVRSPALTNEQLGRMRPAAEVVPEIVAAYRRYRGTQKRPTKRQISIRLDPDVIDHFRSRGKGWQVRINAALRKAAGL